MAEQEFQEFYPSADSQVQLDGKRYVYSDLGFVLLQQVVEKVTELPMDLYLAREVLCPDGITTYYVSAFDEVHQSGNHAHGIQ